jgi:peroxiredoxin
MTVVQANSTQIRGARTPGRGEQIIDFSAPTPEGAILRSRDVYYLRRNLALVFTHGPECQGCRDLLRDLAAERSSVRKEDGEILAVIPGSQAAVGQLRDELGLSYPVVADEACIIFQRYRLVTPEGGLRAAIFATDRYGTVFEPSIANDAHEMMPAEEIPGWLEFIACEC